MLGSPRSENREVRAPLSPNSYSLRNDSSSSSFPRRGPVLPHPTETIFVPKALRKKWVRCAGGAYVQKTFVEGFFIPPAAQRFESLAPRYRGPSLGPNSDSLDRRVQSAVCDLEEGNDPFSTEPEVPPFRPVSPLVVDGYSLSRTRPGCLSPVLGAHADTLQPVPSLFDPNTSKGWPALEA